MSVDVCRSAMWRSIVAYMRPGKVVVVQVGDGL
jgi:hypothetical protein